MTMTSVMSYQYWHYTGFTVWRFRYNIIIDHLLFCLHCFEGFMSSILTVQHSGKRGLCLSQKWKNWGWKQLTLLLTWGRGGRHLKGLTAVAFTLALIVFALI